MAKQGDLTLIASKVESGGEAYLYAGKDLNVLAAQDSDYSLYDMKKKGSFGASKTQRDEVTDVRNVGSEIKATGDVTLQSEGNQTYQAAKLQSGKNLTLDSGGDITFEAVKDLHQESHEKSNNNAFWVSSKGKGQTDETLRQTQIIANGQLSIHAVEGLKIDVKEVNGQTVSQTIDAMVKADPNLAWIKQAEERGDVDWRQVKEIHDSFKYSNSGLGPASQMIIAIAMAVIIGPMAGGLMGGTVTQAVVTTAATNAAVSTINNRGNLGAVLKDVTSSGSLKSYAMAGATAGILQAAGYDATQLKFDSASAQAVGTKLMADTLARTLIYGGSFQDNLKQAALGTVVGIAGANAANAIGDLGLANGSLSKIALHAALGGLMAEAMGGDFRSGALAAGANEVMVNALGEQLLPKGLDKNSPEYQRGVSNLLAASQLVGVLAASLSNSDPQVAATVTTNATTNNYLGHRDVEELADKAQQCQSGKDCSGLEEEARMRSFANHEKLLGCEGRGDCANIRAEIDAGSIALKNLVEKLGDGLASDILDGYVSIGGENLSDWTLAGQLHIDYTAKAILGSKSNAWPEFGKYLDQSGFSPVSINVVGFGSGKTGGASEVVDSSKINGTIYKIDSSQYGLSQSHLVSERFVDAQGLPLPVPPSVGASGRIPSVIQSGGNTLSKSTANSLNEFFGESLTPREWGRALEALKADAGKLPNNFHGRILDNGDYIGKSGELIGNIRDYLP